MKALVFDKSKYSWEKSRGFELADVPKPKIDDKSVIIKVHYAGICGTDRGIWNRQAMRDQMLGSLDQEKKDVRILGHEFFGEIVEVGKSAAMNYKLKVGDFVSCESHVVCNECYQCLHGEKHVCTKEKILGISHDGGFAEYVKVPGHIVWKTNTGKIRPEIAAMQEPFGNAVHAASKVDLRDKTIAVFGLGPIGLFLVLVARALGAKNIIGIEPNPVSQEMAKKLGVDYVIPLKSVIPDLIRDPESMDSRLPARPAGGRGNDNYRHSPEVIDEIMKITDGLGVDVSFEMAGFNSSVNNAIAATRRGGDVILFGLKNGDFVLEDYNKLIVKGLTLHAVIGRELWQTWETTKKLMETASNGIQEKMFNIILDRGEGTILPILEYTKEKFEKMMNEHPKFLIQF